MFRGLTSWFVKIEGEHNMKLLPCQYFKRKSESHHQEWAPISKDLHKIGSEDAHRWNKEEETWYVQRSFEMLQRE